MLGLSAAMERIGRYQIVKELGHGAMGVVYQATDPNIGRTVAIKTIRLNEVDDPERRGKLRDRLFREARSAGVLSHPGIVTIYDMDEDEGVAYITMEFVSGQTLDQLFASGSALPGDRLFHILKETAQALDFAHQKGIVHRDVKPGNLMLDETGSVKITDFGIAKMDSPEDLTMTGTIVGTPNYMSPEQVRGVDVDGASDQFSLAVVAYEALTGERPFPGKQLTTVVYRIVAEQPIPPRIINPTLGTEIDAVVNRGLAKKPADRYPSCLAFVNALELACAATHGWKTLGRGGSLALPTVTEAPALEQSPNCARRSYFPAWLATAFAVLLAAGVVGFWKWEQRRPTSNPALPAPPDPQLAEHRKSPMPPAPEAQADPQRPAEAATPAATLKDTLQQVTPQDIWVTTNPPGARAALDDRRDTACPTPCILRAAPGRHSVSISLETFQPVRREVTVGNAGVDLPMIVLQPEGGTLMLSTVPPGASISVDGRRRAQVTPAQIALPPGSHQVVVEIDGKRSSAVVEIRHGETSLLRVTL